MAAEFSCQGSLHVLGRDLRTGLDNGQAACVPTSREHRPQHCQGKLAPKSECGQVSERAMANIIFQYIDALLATCSGSLAAEVSPAASEDVLLFMSHPPCRRTQAEFVENRGWNHDTQL